MEQKNRNKFCGILSSLGSFLNLIISCYAFLNFEVSIKVWIPPLNILPIIHNLKMSQSHLHLLMLSFISLYIFLCILVVANLKTHPGILPYTSMFWNHSTIVPWPSGAGLKWYPVILTSVLSMSFAFSGNFPSLWWVKAYVYSPCCG